MSQPQTQQPGQAPLQAPLQAPDSPVVVVSGNVQKYAMKKKKILNAEESELFELTQAAGVTMDQEVFKIADTSGVADTSTGTHPPSTTLTISALTTTSTTAPTEHRVRSKAGHGEKSSRESSSQRVQRPPSATRGQKTKSSGSSSSSQA
ncbi:hypothetical protein CRUP_013245 [Coryphaenoides rupestris]|nr:hypothetical protein CRUP_013245 [Coryphaenoides rupestris]